MSLKLMLLTLTVSISTLSLASRESDLEMAEILHRHIHYFKDHKKLKKSSNANVPCLYYTFLGNERVNLIGIDQKNQKKMNFLRLKQTLFELINEKAEATKKEKLKNKRLIQLVGDSKIFSAEGTKAAKEYLEPFLEKKCIFEYGLTGHCEKDHEGREQLDVNSLVTTYLDKNPEEGYRFYGNTVGHTVKAIEEWKCSISPHVTLFSFVYNEHGMDEGFTKFGDDTDSTDFIMTPKDKDLLIILEGGAQSFDQAVHVLKNGVRIKGLFNLRTDRDYFSAVEIFFLFQEILEENKDLSQEEARDILQDYISTHKKWDHNKKDAETKEKQFESAVDGFIKNDLYKKVTDMDITLYDPDGYAKTISKEFRLFFKKYDIEIPTSSQDEELSQPVTDFLFKLARTVLRSKL